MNLRYPVRVIFDYTALLGALSIKTWTFMEAVRSVYASRSLKSLVLQQSELNPEERLWQNAMYYLSTHHSDVLNLMMLCKLAKLEGIDELRIMLPYALEYQQLESIQLQSGLAVHLYPESDEELVIEL